MRNPFGILSWRSHYRPGSVQESFLTCLTPSSAWKSTPTLRSEERWSTTHTSATTKAILGSEHYDLLPSASNSGNHLFGQGHSAEQTTDILLQRCNMLKPCPQLPTCETLRIFLEPSWKCFSQALHCKTSCSAA